jgi:hypothetical protein
MVQPGRMTRAEFDARSAMWSTGGDRERKMKREIAQPLLLAIVRIQP